MSYRDIIVETKAKRQAARTSAMKIAGSNFERAIAGYTGGMGGSGIVDDSSWFSVTEQQYRASTRGYAATAILPIAVRVADLQIYVGHKKKQAVQPEKGKKPPKSYEVKTVPGWVKKGYGAAEDIRKLENHVLLDALADPNPMMCGWALQYITTWSIVATGEAVWVLDPKKDKETGEQKLHIWYVPRHWMRPCHDKGPYSRWKFVPPGTSEDDGVSIPEQLVVHFMSPDPANPYTPISSIQSQSMAVNADDELSRSHLAMTRNITRPSMMIVMGDMDPDPVTGKSSQIELTDEQRREIIDNVRAMYRGAARNGDPMIIDKLVRDVKPYMPQPVDLDYPNGTKLTKTRIFEGIGTNPIIAGQVEGANRASSYVAAMHFNTNRVNPIATLIGSTVTKKVGKLFGGLLIWLEEAQAKDPDLVRQRVALATSMSCLTAGELRTYVETGEIELEPRDDDDDLLVKRGVVRTPPELAEQERKNKLEEAKLPREERMGSKQGGPPGKPGLPQPQGEPGKPAAGAPGKAPPAKKPTDRAPKSIVINNVSGGLWSPYTHKEISDTEPEIADYDADWEGGDDPFSLKSCGTGSGGFKPGNTCASGSSGPAGGGGGWKVYDKPSVFPEIGGHRKSYGGTKEFVVEGKNCGTGAGGFKPGNTCQRGSGRPAYAAGAPENHYMSPDIDEGAGGLKRLMRLSNEPGTADKAIDLESVKRRHGDIESSKETVDAIMGMSHREAAAIMEWTGLGDAPGSYNSVRKVQAGKLGRFNTNQEEVLRAEFLDNVVDRIPDTQAQVYRGLMFDQPRHAETFVKKLAEEGSMKAAALSSVSTDRDVAMDFTGAEGADVPHFGVMLEIKGKRLADIRVVNPAESELLLRNGSNLKYIGHRMSRDSGYIVEMEEMADE